MKLKKLLKAVHGNLKFGENTSPLPRYVIYEPPLNWNKITCLFQEVKKLFLYKTRKLKLWVWVALFCTSQSKNV